MWKAIGKEECVKELLVDGGYYAIGVLEECIKRDISILCPTGDTYNQRTKDAPTKNKISKKDFIYDEITDSYICPQGQRLTPLKLADTS